MRDYQREKNNMHRLPNAVYKQALWQIRDYYRMKEELQDILDESPSPPDGMPHGSGIGKPVEAVVIRREKYADKVRAIEKALDLVPEEYQAGVWKAVQFSAPYPDDAHRNTYGIWKARFVYAVADYLGIV